MGGVVTRAAVRVAHVLSAAAQEAKESDVTMLQVRILAAVAVIGDATPSHIAEKLRISLPVTSKPIDELVQRGHLARAHDRSDRRKYEIKITNAGLDLIERIDAAFRKATRLHPRSQEQHP